MSAEQYRPIVVAYRNGNPVRLEEVASVYDGVENPRNGSWYNGKPALYLGIQRQPGTNTVEVVDAVKELLPELQAQLPGAIQMTIRSDRSVSIRESVHDVKFTLVLTVVLVVLVIFLFLRNLSATIIPSLALPFSIVGTFAIMWALNYSLDNLSLMALTLSVGFVVDDAIVMLENIVRHMEMGKPRMQAAFDGSKEISLHHHLDDGLAGGRLHPDPVHGRHRRPPDARVRGDDRRGDSGVGPGVAHADADAVQPLPQAAARDEPRLVLQRDREDVRRLAQGLCVDADARRSDSRARPWSCRRRCWSAPSISSAIVPKGFIPSVDTGQISGGVEFAQGVGYDTTVVRMQPVDGHPGSNDPNVAAFTADSGGGTPEHRPEAPRAARRHSRPT